MSENGEHHHGQTIREFRKLHKITVAELAERWPSGPVSSRYIQAVEAGDKHISDQETLRRLADSLEIPLWRFGLSEFNPFRPRDLPGQGERIYNETFDVVEHLINQTWFMRRAAPAPETEKSARRLLSLFNFLLASLPPATQLEKRFLRLYAQVHRLNAIMYVERRKYPHALQAFRAMYRVAQELDEPATLALALMGIGTELERSGRKQEAIEHLEQARDYSFQASRQIAALTNAYLARVHAGSGDKARFMRAIDTAQAIATNLGNRYGDGTDHVYHNLSGILAERSYGYLEIGEPERTLGMKGEIVLRIDAANNSWLDAWIPLDWARAYLMLGEIEQSAREGVEFFQRATALQSPHAISRAYAHLIHLYELGYADARIFKEAYEESLAKRQEAATVEP